MNVGSLESASVAGAATASAAYRLAYAALALGVVLAAIVAPQNTAALSLDHFIGSGILAHHAISTHLGLETFSAAGARSGAIGWLGALVAYASARGSGAVGTFLAGLAALATFALVELRARRTAGRAFALGAALLAVLCALGSFGNAGGLLTATFAIVLAEVLDRPGTRATIAATLLAIVWCNVAAQGVLAPGIALVFALGAWLEGRSESEVRARWSAFGATLVAVLVTPGFLAYPAIALVELGVDRDLASIVSYHPVDVAPLAYRLGFFAATFAAFAVGIRRGRPADAVLLAAAFLLALASGAYIAMFGVLVAPLLAASAAEALPRIAALDIGSSRGDAAIAAVSAVLLAFGIVAAPAPSAAVPAYALATKLARDGAPHHLYCWAVEWCDAALAVAPTRTQVFMDTRVGAYPDGVRSDEHDVRFLKPLWRKILRDRKIDALLLPVDRQGAALIALSPEWRSLASDDRSVLYVRRDGVR